MRADTKTISLASPAFPAWLLLPSFAATLFFSAKETAYKAWRMKGALVFRDIRIAPYADGFIAARSGRTLRGRYAVEGDLILTAAWL